MILILFPKEETHSADSRNTQELLLHALPNVTDITLYFPLRSDQNDLRHCTAWAFTFDVINDAVPTHSCH